MTPEQRIKLAEAMGWRRGTYDTPSFMDGDREVQRPCWYNPDGIRMLKLPDPEHDANDDYAVLEWMRENLTTVGIPASGLRRLTSWDYQKGDYARAALKVIEAENDD